MTLIEITNDCNEYECDDASDSDNNFQQLPGSEKLFSSEISKDGEQSEGKRLVIRLKALPTTRWIARYSAVSAVPRNFGTLIECFGQLVELKHDTNEERIAIFLQSYLNWQFVLTLTWWCRVLQVMNTISRLLQ